MLDAGCWILDAGCWMLDYNQQYFNVFELIVLLFWVWAIK